MSHVIDTPHTQLHVVDVGDGKVVNTHNTLARGVLPLTAAATALLQTTATQQTTRTTRVKVCGCFRLGGVGRRSGSVQGRHSSFLCMLSSLSCNAPSTTTSSSSGLQERACVRAQSHTHTHYHDTPPPHTHTHTSPRSTQIQLEYNGLPAGTLEADMRLEAEAVRNSSEQTRSQLISRASVMFSRLSIALPREKHDGESSKHEKEPSKHERKKSMGGNKVEVGGKTNLSPQSLWGI